MDFIDNEVANALNKAKDNNHVTGYIFKRSVCFCKKCNSILTFTSKDHKTNRSFISGLFNSKCNG